MTIKNIYIDFLGNWIIETEDNQFLNSGHFPENNKPLVSYSKVDKKQPLLGYDELVQFAIQIYLKRLTNLSNNMIVEVKENPKPEKVRFNFLKQFFQGR